VVTVASIAAQNSTKSHGSKEPILKDLSVKV